VIAEGPLRVDRGGDRVARPRDEKKNASPWVSISVPS
jgi:hypothetical protein